MTGPRLPGIGAHHSANPQTDEWLTPPHVLDSLGRFDLDPCANHDQPGWTRCPNEYTASDDGLTSPWAGTVWCNPPYSLADKFMARLADHGQGVALVFARTETRWWFESVWPHASALLFLATFYRPDGSLSKVGHNAGGPSVLIAYGSRSASYLVESPLRGALVRIERR